MFCLTIDFVNITFTSLCVSSGNVVIQQLLVLIARYFIQVDVLSAGMIRSSDFLILLISLVYSTWHEMSRKSRWPCVFMHTTGKYGHNYCHYNVVERHYHTCILTPLPLPQVSKGSTAWDHRQAWS